MSEGLPGFLALNEVSGAAARASTGTAGSRGRQGTGYDVLSLPRVREGSIKRVLARIGTPYEDHWDVYFIRYRDGAHILRTSTPRSTVAAIGASPCCSSARLPAAGSQVELAIGGCRAFAPDREVHEVSRVNSV